MPKVIDRVHTFTSKGGLVSDDVPRFKVLKSRREIYSLMRELIQSAQHEVFFVYTANGFYRFSRFEIIDDAIAAARKGVVVRGIITTDTSHIDEFRRAEAAGMQIRQHVEYIGVRFLVVDGRQTVTPISTHDGIFSLDVDDSAFWNNEREYAKQLIATFERLWQDARKISASPVEVLLGEEFLSVKDRLEEGRD